VLLAPVEERQEHPVALLDVTPLGAEEAFEVGRPEILALEQDRRIEEAGRARAWRPVDRGTATAPVCVCGGAGPSRVRGARGRRVIGLEGGKERDLAGRPGWEREPP